MRALKVTRMNVTELTALLRNNVDYQIGLRLAAILLVARGATSRDVTLDLPFVRHAAICDWVNRFNKEGLEGLMPKAKPGKPCKATAEQLVQIRNLVLDHSPEEYGYNTATWTGPLLIDWLSKHMNIHLKIASIYVWLKVKLGLTHKKGKGFYPEADAKLREEKVVEIKKNS